MHSKILPKIVFFIVAIALAATASASSPWNINDLTAEVTFSGQVHISGGDISNLEWLEGSFYIAPTESHLQTAKIVKASPKTYEIETDAYGNRYVKFRWDNPSSRDINYSITWDVDVERLKYAIDSEGGLAEDAPQPIKPFLDYDNLTKWTGFMHQKALSLTTGSNSTLEEVRRLSSWISSMVTYDQSCWKGSFPAEKVFYERRGVCDEFTNLFISFSRSLGIPSKYVEGLVYSGEDWNFHAWAEVYIGIWLPVDVTYNEVGFLDSSHITLAKVQSDSEIYSSLKWASRGIKAEFEREDFEVRVKKSDMKSLLHVRPDLPSTAVSSEIFNVTLDIDNLANSYVVATCSLNMPPEMMLLDWREKSVLLPPNGDSQLVWRVGTPSDLDSGYTYMMPTQILCFPGINMTREITVNPSKSTKKTASATISDLTALNSTKALVTVINDGTAELKGVVVALCMGDDSPTCINKTIDWLVPAQREGLVFKGLNISEGTRLSATIVGSGLENASLETEITDLEGPKEPDLAEKAAKEFLKKSGRVTDESSLMLLVLIVAIVLIIIAIILSFLRRG